MIARRTGRHAGRVGGAAAAAVLLGLLLAPRAARAYPQWQLSTGTTRCNQCHFDPGGGGLITDYGRSAAGDDLSTTVGDGAFLHGALTLPSRLALGANLRAAFVSQDVQDVNGPKEALFPMQAELRARVAVGRGIALSATGGLRGRVRRPVDVVPEQNYQPISQSRFVSREHYAIWQPATQGPYARIGRFYAPFGLRLAEHITYVRRDLGFDLLEETYNVSGGFVTAASELHTTLFFADALRRIGGRESGLASYYEHRLLDERAAVGAQLKVGIGPGANRYVLGGVGKYYVEVARTLLLGEANLVRRTFDGGAVGSHDQFVGAVGAAVLPLRGLMVTGLVERNHVDLQVRDAVWNATTLLLNWFPAPHFEVQAVGRLQFPAGTTAARTFLAQLHYYL